MQNVQPLSPRQRASSIYNLAQAAYSNVNYRSGTSTPGLPPNATISSDTPNGVLSGSIAVISQGSNDWESTYGSYNSPIGTVLGLFATNAAGNAYENNQGSAGGKLAIYMDGGEFTVYVFETNTSEVGYASCMSSYTRGAPLYVSPFGLLTPIKPSTLTSVYTSSPINNVVGVVTKVPTTSDYSLGVRMFAFAPSTAAFTN